MARTTTTGRRRAVVVSMLTTAAVASALLVGIDAPARAGAAQGATAAATTIPPGRLAAAVAKVDSLASDLMAKTHIPGMAVAVVHGGDFYAKGFGVREAGRPTQVDADTVFQLASLSKSLGARSSRRGRDGSSVGHTGEQEPALVQALRPLRDPERDDR